MSLNICVIGGGASGLIAAHYLKSINNSNSITLISPEDIPPIGVGESTTYAFHMLLKDYLNLNNNELKDFLHNIDACYKYGVSYRGWSDKEYLNLFSDHSNFNIKKNLYLLGNKSFDKNVNSYTTPTANFSYKNKVYCDSDYILKDSNFVFSFHFDANKFIKTMTDLAIKRDIKVVRNSVKFVNFDNKKINSLVLKSGEEIKFDYYINCIGNTKVNEEVFGIEYQDYSDILLTDTAIAFPLKYVDKEKQMHPFTVSKTMKYGWRWITPTWSRIGTGYVFSQKYISIDQAIEEFRQDLKDDSVNPFVVDFTPKKCKQMFNDNWSTLGMASGFLEPLDAPGLSMTVLSIMKIADLISNKTDIYEANKWYDFLYNHWCSFILHQYKTSVRSDTQFWRDQKEVSFDFYNNLIEYIFKDDITLEELDNSGYEWDIFYVTTAGKDIKWKPRDASLPRKYIMDDTIELENHYKFLKKIYTKENFYDERI